MCHGVLFKLHKETRNGRLPQTRKEKAPQQREGLLPNFSSREELFRQRGKSQAVGRKPPFRHIASRCALQLRAKKAVPGQVGQRWAKKVLVFHVKSLVLILKATGNVGGS